MNPATDDIHYLEQDICTLNSISDTIKQYGFNQASAVLLTKFSLMTGVSAITFGLESDSSADQIIALEALETEAKEKSAKWSARILGFFKDGSTFIVDKIKSLWNSLKDKAELLTAKAWDTTKATGEVIKAHPYKTILVALAAAAAVFGVVAFVGTSLPVGVVTNGQMHAFMLRLQTMYHRIKLPFGKITTEVVSDGRLIFATVENGSILPATPKTASGLGWTTSAAKAAYAQAGKIAEGAGKGVEHIWNRVLKPGEKVLAKVIFAPKDFKDFVVNKTGMRTAGWVMDQIVPALYYSLLYKLVRNLYDIVKDVVVKTIQMVKDTFSSLTKVLA